MRQPRRGRRKERRTLSFGLHIARREIAQLDDDGSGRGIDVDELPLQANGLERSRLLAHPPLIAIARTGTARRTGRLRQPVRGHDTVAIGLATVQHHLPEAREVSQGGVDARTAEPAIFPESISTTAVSDRATTVSVLRGCLAARAAHRRGPAGRAGRC